MTTIPSATGREGEGGVPLDPYQRPDQDREVVLKALREGEQDELVRLPSNRRIRRTIVLAVWGFTFGSLLLAFSSPARNEFLAPGPLTNHHAQILAGMGGDRCAACHSAGNSNWVAWTRTVFGDNTACPTSQSELCLNCHRQSIDPALAANPHALEIEQLRELTHKHAAPFRTAGLELPVDRELRQLACSTCHVEHHGALIDLTAMSDQQCQTCHAQRHRSFEDGHPEFQLVGAQLPSAIRFDHQTHLQKYFPEGRREFACAACHHGDSERNVMRLGSFEAMCRSCHEQTIRTTGQQGLVLLELPLLDLECLESAGHEVGSWPAGARGDFGGRLHPMTWSLLAKDPELAAALKAFPAGFDFSEVDPGSTEQLGHLAELAKGMKRLLLELSARDFRDVMEAPSSSAVERASTPSGLQVFRDAAAQWFPEMANQGKFATGLPTPAGSGQSGFEPIWLPESAILARWLQDQELLAPNPLIGKVSPTATSGGAAGQQAETSKPESQAQAPADAGSSRQVIRQPAITNPAAQVDDYSGREGITRPAPLRNSQSSLPAANADDKSELLAVNPLQEQKAGGVTQPDLGLEEQSSAHQTDSITNLGQQRNQHAPPHKAAVNQPSQAPAIEPVFPLPVTNQIAQPAILRGWSRDDRSYRLVYYVADHSDSLWPALQHWLNSLEDAGKSESALVLRQSLHLPTAAGACFSCHRTGDQSGAPRTVTARERVGWTSELRRPELKGFTRFSHAPHLLQLQCTGCHQLAGPETGSTPAQLASWQRAEQANEEGTVESSDFNPLGRATCVKCHQQNQAASSCTTCHHYHVDQNWLRVLDLKSGD